MDNDHRTLLTLAALMFGGAVFAQSPALTAPNNSAGTPMDTPPRLHSPAPMTAMSQLPTPTESAVSAFAKLDSTQRGYVTREDIDRLPGSIPFNEADRDHDGRLDVDEFQRAWAGYGKRGQ